MKLKNPFEGMKVIEYIFWIVPIIAIVVAFVLTKQKDYLSLATSILGITSVIFVAKGHNFGQIIALAYAITYGILAYITHYYGELIISALLYMPVAVFAIISWIRHSYKNTSEVEVVKIGSKQIIETVIVAIGATIASFFILRALNTPNLIVSTISITASSAAGYLVIRRSPFYALAYAINDLILIILWGMAAYKDPQYIPLSISFVGFFACDTYGLINWLKMRKKQKNNDLLI